MKRFVIALILLSFATALSATCYFALGRTIHKLDAQVEQVLAATLTDDRDVLREQTGQLLTLWKKNTNLLHMLVMHRAMEEVEMHILLLLDQMQDKELTNFRESCEIIKSQLENLRDSEQISLRNIF